MTRRQRITVAVAAVLAGLVIAGVIGVLSGYLDNRRETDARLTRLAEANGRIGEDIKDLLTKVETATGPEAQARSAANLARIIADIRRSIDCAKLDDEGQFPACTTVIARLDAIRAGLDPFTPTTGAP